MVESVDWRAVADVLASELRRWGWHNPDLLPQASSVVLAIGIYEDACERAAQSSRREEGV